MAIRRRVSLLARSVPIARATSLADRGGTRQGGYVDDGGRLLSDRRPDRRVRPAFGRLVLVQLAQHVRRFALEAASGVYGELQAGSFMFMDADYAQNERDPAQPQFEHALFVKTQIISAHAGHAVCDAGHKSHAVDSGMPKVHSLDARSGLEYFNGGDEHGILRPAAGNTRLPGLGQMLWLIPGHCDPTVNLHDAMIGVGGGLRHGLVEEIFPVDARGALS